jgi:hypothetical protein
MVCYSVKNCLTHVLSRWVDEYRLPRRFAKLPWQSVDCDSESLRDDAVETWSWYPTIESCCKLSSWISCRAMTWVKAYCKKTYKHVVGFFEQHMSGTTNTTHMLFTSCVPYNKCMTNTKASWNPVRVEPAHWKPVDINPGSLEWVKMRHAC